MLKFSRTGEFLLQIGKAGTPGDNDSTTGLNRPAGVNVDAAGSEVYVADGFVNRRVVVFDATTGAYKRHWGATGGEGAARRDTSSRSATVSCAKVAKDGTVYVCDRGNNRVEAFDKTGKLLKEGVVSATTNGTGSVWDVAFSSDPQQRFLYVADGHDQKVFILAATRWRSSAASATAAATRARSTASAAWPSTRRATSTRVRTSRASACRSSS